VLGGASQLGVLAFKKSLIERKRRRKERKKQPKTIGGCSLPAQV